MFGSDSFPVSLIAEGPPLEPVNLTVTGAFSRGVDLQWVAGFDGGVSDMTFEVVHNNILTVVGEEGVEEGRVLNVTIRDLQPDTQYMFEVKARNSFQGRSLSKTATIQYKTTG